MGEGRGRDRVARLGALGEGVLPGGRVGVRVGGYRSGDGMRKTWNVLVRGEEVS